MHLARPFARAVLLLSTLVAFQTAVADASVAARLDARGVQYTVDEDGDYRVTYSYADEGRTQLAYVSGRTEAIGGFQVREVFAPAAFVDRDGVDGTRALALLEESHTHKIGAWEIGGNVLYYVIKLSDGVDAAQLEAALDIAAEMADNKEIELSGDRDEL
jgi:hypothetical protein